MAKKSFMKKLEKANYEPVIHILTIAIVVLFILNLFFVSSLTSTLKDKITEAEELARPAVLELITITAPCDKCFDISKVVDSIKSGNVNVTNEQTMSKDQAKDLILKYNIQRLPTIIVKGELNKTNLNSTLTSVDDALVFTKQTPPYYDVASNSVKGLVVATIIEADNCTNCTQVTPLLNELRSGGVVFDSVISLTETEGAGLIQDYNLDRLPTLILSKDASEYDLVNENWQAVGTVESDGNYIVRSLLPPYKNLTTGKVEGLVTVTYLVDSSCTECYNATVHRAIINGYGVKIATETTLDVNGAEGKAFVAENNITLVPTVVLSKDAKLYAAFYRVFSQVSEESSDGNLIFTSLNLMGTYKDLKTNETVAPQEEE